MTRSPITAISPADADSKSSSRRASLRWLRSWYSSARSYSRRAADSSSSSLSEIGWPAAHESAAAAYGSSPRDTGSVGRDAGGLVQVALGGRLGRQSGGLAGGLGEGGVDVGRVVQLDELGDGLDHLGLADPLRRWLRRGSGSGCGRTGPGRPTGSPAPRRSGSARRSRDPVAMVVQEPAQLLGATGG